MVSRPKMIALLGWIAVFATGCAVGAMPKKKSIAPAPEPEPEPEPEQPPVPEERKRYGVSFAVDSGDERLVTAFVKAAKAWNTALGDEWVTIKEDGDVPVFWVDTVSGLGCPLPADIPEGKYLSGCAVATATPDAHIELSTKIQPERLNGIVLHEMGHVIRGIGGHINKEGSPFPYDEKNIMNDKGDASTMAEPTADDAAFVWEGMKYDYSRKGEEGNVQS